MQPEGFPEQGNIVFYLLSGGAPLPVGVGAEPGRAVPTGDALMLMCCVSAPHSLPLAAWARLRSAPSSSSLLMIFICLGSVFKSPRPQPLLCGAIKLEPLSSLRQPQSSRSLDHLARSSLNSGQAVCLPGFRVSSARSASQVRRVISAEEGAPHAVISSVITAVVARRAWR